MIPTRPARAAINRANSQHSTGPRTPEGKARSSRNALCHGLSSRTAVLPTEDLAAYQRHCAGSSTSTVPPLPPKLSSPRNSPTPPGASTAFPPSKPIGSAAPLILPAKKPAIAFDIVDAHRALAMLGLHGQRLSRQFQKTLQQLRKSQAERLERRQRDLKNAAALSELHKHKGLPCDPAQDGFVFSKDEVEAFAQRLMRLNESGQVEYIRSYAPPRSLRASAG